MHSCAATVPATFGPTAALGIARRNLAAMAAGEADDFARLVHPDAVDHDTRHAPASCRGRGPTAFLSTAHWWRAAFDDLDWEVHEAVAEGDVVVARCTFAGRHVGPFVTCDAGGRVERAYAPTHRGFAVAETHRFRLEAGLVLEHRASRDDLAMAAQLGWASSSRWYRLRCAMAVRRARRRWR